jgi:protein involved in polysaccharide export with SLBB domain
LKVRENQKHMKILTFAGLFLIGGLSISASAQVKPGITVNNHPRSLAPKAPEGAAATRVRVLAHNTNPAAANEEIAHLSATQSNSKPDTEASEVISRNEPRWGSDALNLAPESSRPRISRPTNSSSPATVSSVTVATALTSTYLIGVGDVLDIQLEQDTSRKSTLYTVLEGGVVDYPLASEPISVAGLTSAEVAARLRQQIKIFENPPVVVNVRDYSSHSVTINGLVGAPGAKALRREAVPLYVVLSEFLPLAEATHATITRTGTPPIIVELADADSSATLVLPGDAIKISAAPIEFFFAGGELNAPGQKPYHSGLTLTQAILASGGLSNNAGAKVKLSRQGADGLLLISEYNLPSIQSGKAQDPFLQKGDSLQVEARR